MANVNLLKDDSDAGNDPGEVDPHSDNYRNLFSVGRNTTALRCGLDTLTGATASRQLLSASDMNDIMDQIPEQKMDKDSGINASNGQKGISLAAVVKKFAVESAANQSDKDEVKPAPGNQPKLGALYVCIKNVMNIIGVIFWIREGPLLFSLGLTGALAIAVFSISIAVFTNSSLCTLISNGQIGKGGPYYLLSRNLPSRLARSSVFLFWLANGIGVSMYVSGIIEVIELTLAETGIDFIWNYSLRLGFMIIVLIFLATVISLGGVNIEAVIQRLAFIVTIVSISLFLISGIGMALGGRNANQRARGFNLHSGNLIPQSSGGNDGTTDNRAQKLQEGFGIFFPAVTGFLAGSAMSENLVNPSAAIPRGSQASLAVTGSLYILNLLTQNFFLQPKSSCIENLLNVAKQNSSSLYHGYLDGEEVFCNANKSYGLADPTSMAVYIIWGNHVANVFVAYGILCVAVSIACFSSAMANVMTMLRLLTSMSEDNMLPVPHCQSLMRKLHHLCVCSKRKCCSNSEHKTDKHLNNDTSITLNGQLRRLLRTRLRSGESPVAMVISTVFIAFTMIPVKLDAIANLLTEVILFVYALINFVALRNQLSGSANWRPTYHLLPGRPTATTVIALLGTAFCGFGALVINAYLAFLLLIIILALKKLHKPTVKFTQFSDNHKLNAVSRVLADNTSRHLPPSTYVPRCIMVSETGEFHPAVLRLAECLSTQSIFYAIKLTALQKNKKIDTVKEESQKKMREEERRKNDAMAQVTTSLRQCGITKCTYRDIGMSTECWNTAFQDLIRNEVGNRPLQADTFIAEFPSDWEKGGYVDFCSRIRAVFSRGYGTILVRMPTEHDTSMTNGNNHHSNASGDSEIVTANQTARFINNKSVAKVHINQEVEIHLEDNDSKETVSVDMPRVEFSSGDPRDDFFSTWRRSSGRIGCYWRYDDGGLTVLLSYMLRNVSGAQQRFDVYVRGTPDLDGMEAHLQSPVVGSLDCVGCSRRRPGSAPQAAADTLKRLRLQPDRCEQMFLSGPPPTAQQVPRFAERMKYFIEKGEMSADWAADDDLRSRLQRVYYLKKAMLQRSSEHSLIVVTFPLQLRVGQGNEVPACFYMALLDELSSGFNVPVLMVRGSPVGCLTPYQ